MIKRPESNCVSIPNGSYEAVCKSVVEKDKKFGDEPAKPGLAFVYVLALPTGGTVDLERHVTLASGQKSNLRKDLVALHGDAAFKEAMRSDDAFDRFVHSTIGKSCLVITERRTSGAGNEYSNITGIVPLPPGYGSGRIEPQATVRAGGTRRYDIRKLAKKNVPAAEEMLKSAGATLNAETGIWTSPIELTKLQHYELPPEPEASSVAALGDDDIPFGV